MLRGMHPMSKPTDMKGGDFVPDDTRDGVGCFASVCAVALPFICAAFASLLCGCAGVGDGAKIVEGTDLTFGVQFPYTEQETMAVVNYLTGFRVGVAENARCRVKYTCAETNDYFGMITTRTAKTIDATVTPTVDPDEEEETESATPEKAAKPGKTAK